MQLRYSLLIPILSLLLHLPSTSLAEDKMLNAQLIEGWMKSQSAFEAWGQKHEQKLNEHSYSEEEQNNPTKMSVEDMISPLKSSGLYSEANQLVKQYGFTSIDQWADITLRITKAAAAIEFESQPEMMDTSQLEAFKNSPQISEEHKQLLTQAIERNLAMVKQILADASEADKDAIRPHLPKILKLMDEPN